MAKEKESKKDEKVLDGNTPAGTFLTLTHEGKTAHLKKPDRVVVDTALGYVMPTNGRPSYIMAGEYILLNCWNGGDAEVKSEESEFFYSFCMKAFAVLEPILSGLKKN